MQNNISEKLVSVIVPVYCVHYDYLEYCLNSLVNQTYQNIEIILIDDGSPDRCGEICDYYAEQYPIIKVMHQDNQGVSVARNNGVQVASGEYIMFIDPDDWLEKDCIETALGEIELQNVDLLLFQHCRESDSGEKVFREPVLGRLNREELNLIQMMGIGGYREEIYGFNVAWGKLIQKSVIIENNILFPVSLNRSEDAIFNMYLYVYVNEAYIMDYVGYHYRICEGRPINRGYNKDVPQVMLNILKKYAEFVQVWHADDEKFYICLGIRTIIQVKLIEYNYTFHTESKLKKSEVIDITDNYRSDEMVNKYLSFCKIKDFSGWTMKIRFFLLKNKYYNLYYAFKRISQKRAGR